MKWKQGGLGYLRNILLNFFTAKSLCFAEICQYIENLALKHAKFDILLKLIDYNHLKKLWFDPNEELWINTETSVKMLRLPTKSDPTQQFYTILVPTKNTR